MWYCSAGGALKPTDVEMLWVHVTCAWFRPEVGFPDHETMEPAFGILKIPPSSFAKVKKLPCGCHGILFSLAYEVRERSCVT